jgi:hypothetical protein
MQAYSSAWCEHIALFVVLIADLQVGFISV